MPLCGFREVEALLLSTVGMVFVGMEARNLFSMDWQMNIEVLLGCIVAYSNGGSDKALTTYGADVVGDCVNCSRYNMHSNSGFPILGACRTQDDAEGGADPYGHTANTSEGTIGRHGLFLRSGHSLNNLLVGYPQRAFILQCR